MPASGVEQGLGTLDAIRLMVALLGAALAVTLLARRIRLPYSVALVALGIVLGQFTRPLNFTITPELVLVVLLPGLVFEAAYRIEYWRLRTSLPGVALLAGPGVILGALLIALIVHVGAGLAFDQAFVVGAMLSATDPAAVIATFKQLRSPRRLSTIVEAESLLNDGTGIVVFTLAVAFVAHPTGPLEIGLQFVWVVAGAVVLGLVLGLLGTRLMASVGDHLVEIGVSVLLAYGAYQLADAVRVSPIIATVTAGIVLGNYGRTAGVSEKTLEALDSIWEFAAFFLTGVVFLLVGVAITLGSLAAALFAIAWAVVGALVSRAVIVYGLLGGLRHLRIGRRQEIETATAGLLDADVSPIPFDWLHVIFWAGLRGAVSTALALSLPVDFPNRELLQGVTFGVVLFTLLVEATTAELAVRRWGSEPTTAAAGTGITRLQNDDPTGALAETGPANRNGESADRESA